jgi:hypothetical protein
MGTGREHMGYYRSAWRHDSGAAEYFDDAFYDFADELSPVCYEASEELLDTPLSLVGSRSLAFPAAHRASA